VDYLTLKEKKNLYRIHIALQRLQAEVEMYKARTVQDSLYIADLRHTLNQMSAAITNYENGIVAHSDAIDGLKKIIATQRREIRLLKAKAWLGGVLGGVTAFGAGVGTAFLILKL